MLFLMSLQHQCIFLHSFIPLQCGCSHPCLNCYHYCSRCEQSLWNRFLILKNYLDKAWCVYIFLNILLISQTKSNCLPFNISMLHNNIPYENATNLDRGEELELTSPQEFLESCIFWRLFNFSGGNTAHQQLELTMVKHAQSQSEQKQNQPSGVILVFRTPHRQNNPHPKRSLCFQLRSSQRL